MSRSLCFLADDLALAVLRQSRLRKSTLSLHLVTREDRCLRSRALGDYRHLLLLHRLHRLHSLHRLHRLHRLHHLNHRSSEERGSVGMGGTSEQKTAV